MVPKEIVRQVITALRDLLHLVKFVVLQVHLDPFRMVESQKIVQYVHQDFIVQFLGCLLQPSVQMDSTVLLVPSSQSLVQRVLMVPLKVL